MLVPDAEHPEERQGLRRPLADHAAGPRLSGQDGRQAQLALERLGPSHHPVEQLHVAELPQKDPQRGDQPQQPDGEQLRGGRRRSPDEPDRRARDRGHEREQLEADVGQRPHELRRLLVVEPQAVVGVHSLPRE